MTGLLTWAGVAALGGLGALARLRLDVAVSRRLGAGFPWGTTVVNLTGALLAGLLVGAGVDGAGRTVLAVGALGSFSTFSTWMLETQRQAEEGRTGRAAANLALGVAAGAALAALGWWLGSLT